MPEYVLIHITWAHYQAGGVHGMALLEALEHDYDTYTPDGSIDDLIKNSEAVKDFTLYHFGTFRDSPVGFFSPLDDAMQLDGAGECFGEGTRFWDAIQKMRLAREAQGEYEMLTLWSWAFVTGGDESWDIEYDLLGEIEPSKLEDTLIYPAKFAVGQEVKAIKSRTHSLRLGINHLYHIEKVWREDGNWRYSLVGYDEWCNEEDLEATASAFGKAV